MEWSQKQKRGSKHTLSFRSHLPTRRDPPHVIVSNMMVEPASVPTPTLTCKQINFTIRPASLPWDCPGPRCACHWHKTRWMILILQWLTDCQGMDKRGSFCCITCSSASSLVPPRPDTTMMRASGNAPNTGSSSPAQWY